MKVDDWVFAVGVTLGGLALIGLFLALGKDWLRGRRKPQRRRCPKCWYNMVATPGLRCPECGKEAANEKRLAKCRRRWRLATFCVFIISASSISVWKTRGDPYGWIQWTPSFVLIRLADCDNRLFDPSDRMQSLVIYPYTVADHATIEMVSRYENGELTLAQRRYIAKRNFAKLPPITFESRGQWAAGVDLYVVPRPAYTGPLDVNIVATLPSGQSIRLHSESLSEVLSWWPPRWVSGVLINIGPWPLGTRSIPFAVTVKEGGDEIWSGTVPFPVRVDAQINELVEPVSSGLAARLVRGALTRGVSVSADGRWLRVNLGVAPEWTMIGDLTLGLEVAFMYGDEMVAWTTIAHTPVIDPDAGQSTIFSGTSRSPEIHVPIFGETARLVQCHEQLGWELRFIGDGGTALRDFGAITFWEGEVVVPLASVMEREAADAP